MKVPFSAEYFDNLAAEYTADKVQGEKEKAIAEKILRLLTGLKVLEIERILNSRVLHAVKQKSEFLAEVKRSASRGGSGS